MEAISKKICMLGDFAVGKTSLVRRFVYEMFDDRYISTIGVKVSRKPLVVASGDRVVDLTLMLWDLAGSEEFSQMRNTYLRGAAGALLVYDVTRPATLSNLPLYAEELQRINSVTAAVVIGNKVDLLPASGEGMAEGAAMAEGLGLPFLTASALTGDRVEDAFRRLGQLLVG